MIDSFFALRKSGKALRAARKLYLKRAPHWDPLTKKNIFSQIQQLQAALDTQNLLEAKSLSKDLLTTLSKLDSRVFWKRASVFWGSLLLICLPLAVVIRQMWFELYSIPTASMRPTLKEKDCLMVSKSTYGLNIPLMRSHFYFDPSLVKRGDVSIFTSKGLDVEDSDMLYFYLFPGKKQFVKRLIGKPGDTLYFYGGKIYGIDAEGKEIREFLDASWAQSLEYIPFISFEGRTRFDATSSSLVYHQMNLPVASLKMSVFGSLQGKMIAQQEGGELFEEYADLWGMRNYAMARLLLPDEAKAIYPEKTKKLETAPLYLELTHSPSLKQAVLHKNQYNQMSASLGTTSSLLPLTQEHIQRISDHLTTARFTVSHGVGIREGFPTRDPNLLHWYPRFDGIPDGTYEIQNGKVYQVYVRGVTKELPKSHPLYPSSVEKIQQLFNLGIDFSTRYSPRKDTHHLPSRYAYFRDGSLYLMGAPILWKEEAQLQQFLSKEQAVSMTSHSFVDRGAPIKADGTFDVELIRKYGLVVPKKMYLALGDNHAMSGDSRVFGFVPEENLKGTVSFLFSPPGDRWGRVAQPASGYLNFPNCFVWGIGLFSLIGYGLYTRRKERLAWMEAIATN